MFAFVLLPWAPPPREAPPGTAGGFLAGLVANDCTGAAREIGRVLLTFVAVTSRRTVAPAVRPPETSWLIGSAATALSGRAAAASSRRDTSTR